MTAPLRRIRNGQRRRSLRAAGRPEAAARVEQRDLAELREVEDVIHEDALLLPVVQPCAPDFSPNRGEDANVVGEVEVDLLGDLFREFLVSAADRLLGASL